MATVGDPYLHLSTVHARLGDPVMFPLPPEMALDRLDVLVAPEAPEAVPHDPQLAVLTLAIQDLTDAIHALTVIWQQPPWYRRLGRWLRRTFWRR